MERLDANHQPTTGTPAFVRFTNVVGHFSTWAVAIANPQSAPPPPGSGGGSTSPAPPPSATKKCKKGFKKVKGKCKKKRKKPKKR